MLILLLSTALAQEPEQQAVLQAERVRLSEGMRKLASRNVWEGVDRNYRELEALQIELHYDDHYLGAQAAWELGDADSARVRLDRALQLKGDPQVRQWLTEIHASYSAVHLEGGEELQIAEMPIASDQRAALLFAQTALAEDGAFVGMLPNGRYTFGEESFELFPGRPEVVVGLSNAPELGLGLGGSLGVALTRASTGTGDQIQPTDFSGVGLRFGVGPQLAVGEHLGAGLELGYQSLFSSMSSMHLGYGWLAVSGRLEEFVMRIGPTYALGRANTTGLDAGLYQDFCARFPEDARCGWVDIDAFPDAPISGRVRMGGGAAGLSWLGGTLGPMQWGGEVSGGLYTDTQRSYPWAQLALTVLGQ